MLSNRLGWARRPFSAHIFLLVLLLSVATARAGDFGAVSATGTWSDASTWTPAGVPGASDDVFIGSTIPAGAALTANVTLTQDQFASTLILGNGSGSSGTLNLGNYNLIVGGYISIGETPGATGSIVRGSGALTTPSLYVAYANNFTFGTSDAVSSLESYGTASVAITSSGNITGTAYIHDGSSISLGTDMLLNNEFDLRDSGSTLDMGGHKLSAANYIFLGWYNSGVPTLVNRGPLATANLLVANQPFNLAPADAVTNFYLSNVSGGSLGGNSVSYLELDNGSQMITTTTANVTGSAYVNGGSVLTLGADMLLNNEFDLRDSGTTLNMAGHKLSARTTSSSAGTTAACPR